MSQSSHTTWFEHSNNIHEDYKLRVIIMQSPVCCLCCLVSSGGVRLNSLGTSATSLPTVTALDDRWAWSIWWNENWQGKPKYSEKTCPNVTLSITNPTWFNMGSNFVRRSEKPTGTAPEPYYFIFRANILCSIVLSNILNLCSSPNVTEQIYFSMALQPFVGPWSLLSFLIFIQSVGLLGRWIRPSQGFYLYIE
jgi:hypothetical protein